MKFENEWPQITKEHQKIRNHKFDFNETKIITREDNYYELSIKEMIHIKKTAKFRK